MADTTVVKVTPTLRRVLDKAGAPDDSILEKHSNSLLNAAMELNNLEQQLQDAGARVRRATERVDERIRDGDPIDGSGELQPDGVSFDTLCAQHEKAVRNLTAMVQMAMEHRSS